jgi:predicted ABC-type ATPase
LYSKERQALHREIIGKYFEKHAAEKGNSPEMIILGGIGGSGKSSFGDQAKTNPLGLYQEKKFMVIDSDGVKAMIPGFNGGNAAVYHEESSYLMRKIVTRARAQGYNVVLDQTMSKPADATIQAFKKAGYKTAAYYMYVPPATAASRALSRWRSKGPGQRGRLVPPSIILGSTQNPKNFDRAAKMVDKHAFYDNQGAAPRLVFKGP